MLQPSDNLKAHEQTELEERIPNAGSGALGVPCECTVNKIKKKRSGERPREDAQAVKWAPEGVCQPGQIAHHSQPRRPYNRIDLK